VQELRRLPDPPIIVLCDFASARADRWAESLGADAVARDPEALVHCVAARHPGPGRRRWGVRIERGPGNLRLSPTGRLDATSAGRLEDVVASRRGTFERLVLDLSDVVGVDPTGARALARWPAWLRESGTELAVVAGTDARAALHAAGALVPLADA
jgi:anti-anti-sigma regulatory factor